MTTGGLQTAEPRGPLPPLSKQQALRCNDSIPTANTAVRTIAVVLKGLVENVQPRSAGVWQAQMYKTILAICHRMLPTMSPAHECSAPMLDPISLSKEPSLSILSELLSTETQRSYLALWIQN